MGRSGHIYVMRVSDEAVKVGFSKNPARRAVELGTLDVLHHTEWLDHAELIEKSAHRLLKLGGKHIKDEIFSASVKEAIAAINDAIEMAAGGELRLDSERPFRRVKAISVCLDRDAVREVDLWVAKQTYRTTRSAAIEVAVREWIERQKAKE